MEKIQIFGISIPIIYVIYLVPRLLISFKEGRENIKIEKETKYMSEKGKEDYLKERARYGYVRYEGIGGKIASILFCGILGILLIGGLIILIITLIEYY